MQNTYDILGEKIIVLDTINDNYDTLKKYLSKYLTDYELEVIEKYKNNQDKINHIISYTLPKIELAKILNIEASNVIIERIENERPYYKDYDYYYSVSHSDHFVAFVLSKNNVGLDIDHRQFKELKALSYVASDDEINECISEDDKLTLWTFKEAYSKYVGKGLGRYLIDISKDNIKENTQTIYINHLVITLVK